MYAIRSYYEYLVGSTGMHAKLLDRTDGNTGTLGVNDQYGKSVFALHLAIGDDDGG